MSSPILIFKKRRKIEVFKECTFSSFCYDAIFKLKLPRKSHEHTCITKNEVKHLFISTLKRVLLPKLHNDISCIGSTLKNTIMSSAWNVTRSCSQSQLASALSNTRQRARFAVFTHTDRKWLYIILILKKYFLSFW